MNPRVSLCLVALVILVLNGEVEGWRRRRRRRCPVTNCAVSNWSPWSSCTLPCGTGGQQIRTRKVTKQATCGGSCSAQLKQSRACNIGCSGRGIPHKGRCDCKTGYSGRCCTGVDGGWSNWAAWTSCTKTCGSGSQQRARSCTQPTPLNNGRPCLGSRAEKRQCNRNPCPVDGGWSKWAAWTSCTKTCGSGSQQRARSCTQPTPLNNGRPCLGSRAEKRVCNRNRCPVDGGWSGWGFWSPCSKPCGLGIQDRSRSCSNPVPSNGGRSCSGAKQEKQMCNTSPCPVDGGWSRWSSWTPCSKPCGSGEHDRSRSCTNPAPQNGGKSCLGAKREEKGCNTHSCPMDGAWSVWGAWSLCDKSCGGGFRERTRSCTNPPPSFGGSGCGTSYHESSKCSLEPCSVNGGWSKWGNWSECSAACGTGTRSRVRLCDNPVPVGDGKPCTGEVKDTEPCSSDSICLFDMGCYGKSNLFPDLLGDLRGEINWSTTSFGEEMKRIVQKCASMAMKKKLRFFAVENFGKCYGNLLQVYTFDANTKGKRCNYGVGLVDHYYVYMVMK